MELIILGTGNAMATRCYNTCFALKNKEEYFLVDAGGGNGILVQMEYAGIPFDKLKGMFVTHGHTDHVLGVIWVIRMMASLMTRGKYEGIFTIYCHDQLVHMLKTFCEMTLPQKLLSVIGDRIVFCQVNDGEQASVMDMKLTFFDIWSTKAKQYGFRAVLPEGKVIVCLGDEPYNDACRQYAEKCDWMLAEAFCLYEDRERFKPYEKNHSTALDSGRLAEELDVSNLVLYHTEDTNLAERKAKYGKEAKSVFSGQVYVPDDLERIDLV